MEKAILKKLVCGDQSQPTHNNGQDLTDHETNEVVPVVSIVNVISEKLKWQTCL